MLAKQSIVHWVWLLLVAMILAACGGGGGGGTATNGGSGTSSGTAGIYEGNYDTRSNGRILIGVDAQGAMSITVDDNPGGVFVGSGQLAQDNSFSVICTNEQAQTVTVSGTLTGSGLGRTVSGLIQGTISVGYAAGLRSTPDLTPFTGELRGTWIGSQSGSYIYQVVGTWSMTVGSQGEVTARWKSGAPDVVLTGTVSPAGALRLEGADAVGRLVVEGNLSLVQGRVWGTGTFIWGDTRRGTFRTYVLESGGILINRQQPGTHPPRTGLYKMDYNGTEQGLYADLITGAYTHAATMWGQIVFSTLQALYIKPGQIVAPIEIVVPDRPNTLFVHNAVFTENGTNLAFTADVEENGQTTPAIYTSRVYGNTITATRIATGMSAVGWDIHGARILAYEPIPNRYVWIPASGGSSTVAIQSASGATLIDVDGESGRILARLNRWLGFFEPNSADFVPLVDLTAFERYKKPFWSGDGQYAIYTVPHGDGTWDMLRVSVSGGLPIFIKNLPDVYQPVDAIAN